MFKDDKNQLIKRCIFIVFDYHKNHPQSGWFFYIKFTRKCLIIVIQAFILYGIPAVRCTKSPYLRPAFSAIRPEWARMASERSLLQNQVPRSWERR